MKVALVHDWLITLGGAEKVLENLARTFPARIYTLLRDENKLRGSSFEDMAIKTSFIQKLPLAKRYYRSYLPLFPLAIEQFDLSSYDLVLSSSHCIAKGVLTHAEQMHVCYCHTPMRYAWDFYQQYLRESQLKSGIRGGLAKLMLHYLRLWDAQSSARVDLYIANSKYVARRIAKTYRQKAEVVYPPANVEYFTLHTAKEDFYVTASRFVPYKKIDLIVEAFGQMPDKKLIVIGEGPDQEKIKKKAKKNVEFLGFQNDESLRFYLQRARAFVFAAVEDFGILPVEAQACGTPIIAIERGGALETVVPGQTGVFFQEQTIASVIEGVREFEKVDFDPYRIRAHAETFSHTAFSTAFKQLIDVHYQQFQDAR